MQQLVSELGTKTDEFHNTLESLKQQRRTDPSQKGRCIACEAAEDKNLALAKELTASKVELGRLKLDAENSAHMTDQVRKERDEMEKMVVKFREQLQEQSKRATQETRSVPAAETEELKRAQGELREAQIASEMAKEENMLLKSSIQDLEKELEELKSKGSGKVDLMKLRASYNELEGKYKSLLEENRSLVPSHDNKHIR